MKKSKERSECVAAAKKTGQCSSKEHSDTIEEVFDSENDEETEYIEIDIEFDLGGKMVDQHGSKKSLTNPFLKKLTNNAMSLSITEVVSLNTFGALSTH